MITHFYYKLIKNYFRLANVSYLSHIIINENTQVSIILSYTLNVCIQVLILQPTIVLLYYVSH